MIKSWVRKLNLFAEQLKKPYAFALKEIWWIEWSLSAFWSRKRGYVVVLVVVVVFTFVEIKVQIPILFFYISVLSPPLKYQK